MDKIRVFQISYLDTNCRFDIKVNFFAPYNNQNMRGIWDDGILESRGNVGEPIVQPGFEVRQSDNEAIRDLEATAQRKQQ